MIDSTIVRAHQQAATRRKKGALTRLWDARGGLTSQIHPLANDLGPSVDFLVPGAQVNERTQAIELLRDRKAVWVLAYKGYESQTILDHIEPIGAVAMVPHKSNRKQ